MEPLRHVVRGQTVAESKKDMARQLRKTMTPAEQLLWDALRGRRLEDMKFRRQQVIAGYIADIYCHAARLVIELDGAVHQRQREYDAERDTAIALYGPQVLRFSNDDVLHDLGSVLHKIAAAIGERDGGTNDHRQSPH